MIAAGVMPLGGELECTCTPEEPEPLAELSDPDRDGVTENDNCPAVGNQDQTDRDGDGAGDACDKCPGIADDQADADNDGIGDACDICRDIFDSNVGVTDCNGNGQTDPGERVGEQCDSDGDGVGDACEDDDGDGTRNGLDNCRSIANRNAADTDCNGDGMIGFGEHAGEQCDSDGDTVGDACEDQDGDGTQNQFDNCPAVFNVNSDNIDCNGNNVIEQGEFAQQQCDSDGDGLGDACDNCPLLANEDQADADQNMIGDACEDVDGDGIVGAEDNCPTVKNADQQDAEGDGVGDVCDNCKAIPNPRNSADVDCNLDGMIGPREHKGEQCDDDGDGLGDACDCPFDDRALHCPGLLRVGQFAQICGEEVSNQQAVRITTPNGAGFTLLNQESGAQVFQNPAGGSSEFCLTTDDFEANIRADAPGTVQVQLCKNPCVAGCSEAATCTIAVQP